MAFIGICTGVRAGIVDTAENYLHVRERGNNSGKDIALFLKSVNINHPAPWCAAYVNYVLQKSNTDHKMNGMASSCCPNKPQLIYNKGKKNFEKEPQAGDLFFWYRTGGGHTGIITDWPKHGDYFYTIEGNVTCDDGKHGVSKKTRKKSNVQKVFAASMLSAFVKEESEPIQEDTVIRKIEDITNPQPKQEEPPKKDNTPYTVLLIGAVLLILYKKGYITK